MGFGEESAERPSSIPCPECGAMLLRVATLHGSTFQFSGFKCEPCGKRFGLQEIPIHSIGQRVYWQGQEGQCSGVVQRITHPENSGFVLYVKIRLDAASKKVSPDCQEKARKEH